MLSNRNMADLPGEEDSGEEDWSVAWDKSDFQSPKKVTTSTMGASSFVNVAKMKDLETEKTSDTSLLSRMQLNDNKAGMEGLDKEKINQIIYETSKGSRYYENELKKEEQVKKRIAEQKAKMAKLTDQNIKEGELLADCLLQELESTRILDRVIVHIDMDAFYAAVEMRDQPSLKDKPMAVGGNSMLCTSNYVARKYGVRAAMPGFIAKKLCPQLLIVPTNFDKYTAVSKQVREIMAGYDPNFCPMSLDEAYLDFTEHLKVRKNMTEQERSFPKVRDLEDCACRVGLQKSKNVDGENIIEIKTMCDSCGLCINPGEKLVFGYDVDEAVQEMRHRIHLRTRLTASAGIAPNTMLSKVCSDKHKPNGQYRIQPNREVVMEFVKDLPIRKVGGIGKVSEKMLSSIGVVTCSDLYSQRGLVYHLYSNISYNYFMRICLGLGSTEVCRDGDRKSLSTERTFREINKPEELFSKCAELCEDVVQDLQKEQLLGKTVGIKLKTVKFELKTRAMTISDYTQNYEQIFKTAKELLKVEINACHPQPLRLRLMGVKMSSLMHENEISKQTQNRITNFLKMKNELSPNKSLNGKEEMKTEDGGKVSQQNSVDRHNLVKPSNVLKTMIQKMGQKSPSKAEFTGPNESNSDSTDIGMGEEIKYHSVIQNCQVKEPHLDGGMNQDLMNCTEKYSHSSEMVSTSEVDTSTLFSSANIVDGDVNPVRTMKRKSVESIQCPVCNRTIKSSSAKVINNHIDYCLMKKGSVQKEKEQIDSSTHLDTCDSVESSVLEGESNKDPIPMAEVCENIMCSSDTTLKVEDDELITNISSVGQCNEEDSSNKIDKIIINSDDRYKNKCTANHLNVHYNLNNEEVLQDACNNVIQKEIASEFKCNNSDISNNEENTVNNEYCKPGMVEIGESHQQSELMLQQTSTGGVGYDSYPLICPVCNVSQYEMNLSEFNQHVDSCLSKKAIKEILHEHDSPSTSSNVSVINNNNNKRTIVTPNKGKTPKHKKRKIEKGLQTLESFIRTDNC